MIDDIKQEQKKDGKSAGGAVSQLQQIRTGGLTQPLDSIGSSITVLKRRSISSPTSISRTRER